MFLPLPKRHIEVLTPSVTHIFFWYVYDFTFFEKDFIYLFLEREREGEREGEKHEWVIAFHTPPTGDLAHNPGMCPDRELNQWPSGLQPMLNPLSHTSQGWFYILKLIFCYTWNVFSCEKWDWNLGR